MWCETSSINFGELNFEEIVNKRQKRPEELQFQARIVDTMRPDPTSRGGLTPEGMGSSASA